MGWWVGKWRDDRFMDSVMEIRAHREREREREK